MIPERLNFLSEFTNFYNKLVLDLKEDRYNEAEFYLIITAKVKSMDRGRRDLLNSNKIKTKKDLKGLKNRLSEVKKIFVWTRE